MAGTYSGFQSVSIDRDAIRKPNSANGSDGEHVRSLHEKFLDSLKIFPDFFGEFKKSDYSFI